MPQIRNPAATIRIPLQAVKSASSAGVVNGMISDAQKKRFYFHISDGIYKYYGKLQNASSIIDVTKYEAMF